MDNTAADTTSSLERVLAAIAELGTASAAAIGEKAGMAYSTTTPKLRTLEEAGRAQRFRTEDGRTLWRLADNDTTAHHATTSRDDPAPALPADVLHTAAAESPAADPAPPPAEPVAADDTGPTHDQATGTPEPTTDTAEAPAADPAPPAGPAAAEAEPAGTAAAKAGGGQPGTTRRGKGALRSAVLAVLQANPDTGYKVGDLCKLIDQANEGTGAKNASPGAVLNALVKLAADGSVTQTVQAPATFRAV